MVVQGMATRLQLGGLVARLSQAQQKIANEV